MRHALIVVLVPALLAGCASTAPPPDGGASPGVGAVPADTEVQRRARLRHATGLEGVAYDSREGTCSDGSAPLIDRAAYDALREGWTLAQGCTAPVKLEVPGRAAYPPALLAAGIAGSARLLVRIEPDGRVASARAVCATDPAFARAAEDAARGLAFNPARCGDAPVRSAVLVRLGYDPR